MKLVIQRVNHASVTVEGKVTGEIKKGYLVLLGVGQGDDESMVERYVKKLHKLRIFSDEEGKINRSVEHGIFGAEMKVSLENDGPFTVIWDSREW